MRRLLSRATGMALLLIIAMPLAAMAQEKATVAEESKPVILHGHVVCITEELQRLYQVTPDCERRGHVYGLKTTDGKLYPFLPTDTAAAIFSDQRVRERELRVTARLFPQAPFIEVIKLQSLREGKLYDLYYYCEVCNITTHKPGHCVCCQQEVEFRETPAEADNQP